MKYLESLMCLSWIARISLHSFRLLSTLVQHCRIKSFLEGKKLVFRVLKSEEKFRSAEELLR